MKANRIFLLLFLFLLSLDTYAQDTTAAIVSGETKVIYIGYYEEGKASSHSKPVYIYPGQTIRIRTKENHHPQLGRLLSVTDSGFVMYDSALSRERNVRFGELTEIGWKENKPVRQTSAKDGKKKSGRGLLISGGALFIVGFAGVLAGTSTGNPGLAYLSIFPMLAGLVMVLPAVTSGGGSHWAKKQISPHWRISAIPKSEVKEPVRKTTKSKKGKQAR